MSGSDRGGRRLGLAALAAIAALALAGWWMLRSHGRAPLPPPSSPPDAVATKREPLPADAAGGGAESVSPERVAEAHPAAPADSLARPAPERFTRELAGLRGRLVEEDGSPVPDKKVELIRIHPDLLAQWYEGGFAPPPRDLVDVDVDVAKTDAEGRFLLENASVGDLTVLGIDLGGPRGTVRLVDVALERGQTADLGDLILPPHVTLTGTVVDEEGAPVAGARVRVVPQLPVPIPTQALEVGLQDVRSDSAALVAVTAAPGRVDELMNMVVEMPSWLRAGFERIPLPTTETDADGRFRLPGVPAGVVTLLADRKGLLGVVKAGLPTGRRAETSAGTIRLSSGRTVTGRVLAGEAPLASARVLVGTALALPIEEAATFAIGQPAGTTDADGRFALSGLPLNGSVVCAVAREAGDPWRVFGPFDRDDPTIELPATAMLEVRLLDPAGKPVARAELRFLEANPLHEVPIFAAPRELSRWVTEHEEGRYVVRGLEVGGWTVLARAAGFGIGQAQVDLPADGATAEIALPPARSIAVRVVAAADGAPVEHALVTAMVDASHFIPMPFRAARTDAEGAATLDQLPAAQGTRIVLRATHPGFAVGIVPAAESAAGAPAAGNSPDAPAAGACAALEIALLRGGDLAGRVTVGGEAPPQPLMIMLLKRGRETLPEEEWPRFAVTAPDGSFRVRHLSPGEWSWNVFLRFFAADPLALWKTAMDEPDELAKGSCTIEEGKETRLEIEALPPGETTPAIVRGRVRVDGESREGLQVRLTGRRWRQTQCDAGGRFEFEPTRPGSYALEVVEESEHRGTVLHREPLELRAGETRDVDVDVRTVEAVVVVAAADGRPLADATVHATFVPGEGGTPTERLDARALTDAQGRAALRLRAGRWIVTARHEEVGRRITTIDVGERGSETFELVLDAGVVAAGRVDFEGAAPTGENWYLMLRAVRSGKEGDTFIEGSTWLEVSPQERTFEFPALEPGRYQAQLYSDGPGGLLVSDEFTVGPAGARDLLLVLRSR
jgi:hypothetical protein